MTHRSFSARTLALTAVAIALVAFVVPTPVSAQTTPDYAAAWQAVKNDLSAGDVDAARATYEDTFSEAIAALDADFDARILAAFDDAAAHGPDTLNFTLATQTIDKGILHGAWLNVENALYVEEDAEGAEAWFDVLHAKFGASLDDAYVLIEEMEHDASKIPPQRDGVKADVLGTFLLKVKEEVEEVFLFWDNATAADGYKRQEKAIEGLVYYGPLRANVTEVVGAALEEELHHELEELVEYSIDGDVAGAEHARDEIDAIIAKYEGGGEAATGLEAGVSKLATVLDLLVAEYDEYVQDGQVVDEHGYEEEVKALFLPTVHDRWAAIEADVAAIDAHEAEEIGELIAELDTKILNLAPNADVRATADHIKLELSEVTGVKAETPDSPFAEGLAEMRAQLAEIVTVYAAGDKATALAMVQSTYLDTYGPKLESKILANAPTLNKQIEELLNVRLKAAIQSDAPVAEVQGVVDELDGKLTAAEAAVVQAKHPVKLFFDSLLIIVREGFEAILVVGAVATYLIRTGHRDKLKDIWIGVGAALVATLLLYVAVQFLFELSGANREILEGVTALLAVAVLFYVSYWLISKVQIGKWNRFIQGKVRGAIASGNAWALVGVSFLAVFREGLETVLFYQGLYSTTGAGQSVWVTLGFVVGCVALVGIFVAFYKYGVKIKMRPFFIVTSVLLYYLAFTFMGAGIHELQEAGVVGTTVVGPMAELFHNVPALGTVAELFGIYPTVETLLAQSVLVVLGLAGILYTFQVEPRLARRKQAVPAEE